ncbi:MAG TPA: cupin domain-containing protein [Phycicoccus sp.]|nr:cupin domain-containing protein [Phycicoccus sp.]
MITRLDHATVHVTPNATMRRYAGTEVAVWRTEMGPSASGPSHRIDRDVVVVLVDGALEVHLDDEVETLDPGDAVLIPSGSVRRLMAAEDGAVTLSAAFPGGVARVGDGEPVIVPWSL